MKMTKLDKLVKKSMLQYPSLYEQRWDVLRYLYLAYGTGYEWKKGELVCEFPDKYKLKECHEHFFDDLDRLQSEHEKFWTDHGKKVPDDIIIKHRMERKRRQFVLDNLDDLVLEKRLSSHINVDCMDLYMGISENYSPLFNVPSDVEESFKEGAYEVLNVLIPKLYYSEQRNEDHGLRKKLIQAQSKIDPERFKRYQEGIQEVLDALKGKKD